MLIQFIIIIPIYNSQNTLKNTLDSLKNQTYKNYKAILIDDGSTDNSYDIAQEYTQYNRIILHKHKNSGVSIARNKALKIAQEEYEKTKAKDIYVCFLDSDDLLENFALEHYKNIIEENKNIQCILSNSVYYANYDYTNKELQENYFFNKEIINTNLISPQQIAFHLRNEWHSPCMYCYDADFLFSTKYKLHRNKHTT
ncbi:glycosyltransferase family A protein [Helicobacter ibis]|uniref:glycosyltransferase family A protein n=1 Tax=Helicobacter ibis TaxID=2962633 RepID=UPI0022EBA7D4|nr:glycosyltransferase family A protein [Helicobacter ibis]